MKNFILKSVIFSFILSLFSIGTYFVIQARQANNPGLTEPAPTGGLYVNTNETLSAAKRNSLVDKVVNSRVFCNKINPTKGRAYDCSGNDIGSIGVDDDVHISCPTGYYVVGGGGQVAAASQLMRQNNSWGYQFRSIASSAAIEEIEVICLKIK